MVREKRGARDMIMCHHHNGFTLFGDKMLKKFEDMIGSDRIKTARWFVGNENGRIVCQAHVQWQHVAAVRRR